MAKRCMEKVSESPEDKAFTPFGGDPYGCATVPLWQRMAYAPAGWLLRMAAALPAPLCHGMADGLAWLARSVVRYRRRVVRRNLADCFPASSAQWRQEVEKGFYRNLADYVFQTAGIAFLNQKRLMRHISFSGLEEVAATLSDGRDIVLYTSHFGNWEYIPLMAAAMPKERDGMVFAHVVRPLKNLWFNSFFHRLRSRFNTSVPQKQTARAMIGWRRCGQRFIIGFLSDQKPGRYTQSTEVDFLNRRTPFIEGTEVLAAKLHTAVFYTDVHREGRDRIRVDLVKMADDAAALPPGALTADYARRLTDSIRRDPAAYLWSHNRWRLKKEDLSGC